MKRILGAIVVVCLSASAAWAGPAKPDGASVPAPPAVRKSWNAAMQQSNIGPNLTLFLDSTGAMKVVTSGACSGTGAVGIWSNLTFQTDASGNLKTCGTGTIADAFSSLIVSGQTTIAASGSTALTVVAGANVTLTTDNTTKTLTIDAGGGGTGCNTSGAAMLFGDGAGGCTNLTSSTKSGANLSLGGTLSVTGAINKITFTAPATGSTLTIADGKTLTASNTLTFTGTDSSSVAFRAGGTVAYTTGSPATDDCAKFDSSGRLVTAGAACGSGGGGANTALSNLASVSINDHLKAQNPVDLGDTTHAFRDLFLWGGGTYGSTSFRFTGTPTGNRTITFPDATGNIVLGSTGSTDNRLLRSDGTSTTLMQASAITVDDSGNLSGAGTVSGANWLGSAETKSSSATLSKENTLCDPTSGAVDLTLPSVSTFSGYTFYVKQITSAANVCTVKGTIDGVTDDVIGGIGYGASYYSNGTTWNAKTQIAPPITSITDGQLLIGNTATGLFTKATLTAGSNVTITNGNGSISIAASGGGGTGCVPSGTIHFVLTDDGSGACTSNAGFTYGATAGLAVLGVANTTAGKLKLNGGTSGDVTLQANAVAGTSITATFPATSTVIPIYAYQVTYAGFTGAHTVTFPVDAAFTIARQDAAQTFTGVQTFSSAPIISSLTGLLVGNGSSAVNTITPGTGVATALAQNVSGSGAICLASGSACAGGGGGTVDASDSRFRLTLETGVCVSTSDQSAKGTLYFTPGCGRQGNTFSTYDSSVWTSHASAEISLSLTATSGKNYDVFVDYSGSVLELSLSAAWTDDTTRANALGAQDGVVVLGSDHSKRWVGTIRASATNQTSDTNAKRYVWNAVNRAQRSWAVYETTASWTYNVNTLRQANGSSANQVDAVFGAADMVATIQVQVAFDFPASTAQSYAAGIGQDGITALAQTAAYAQSPSVTGNDSASLYPQVVITPAIGRHYYTWLEITGTTNGNVTVYSGSSGVGTQSLTSGISGTLWN